MRSKRHRWDSTGHELVRLEYLSLICTILVAMGVDDHVSIGYLGHFFEGIPFSSRWPPSSLFRNPSTPLLSVVHHLQVFAPVPFIQLQWESADYLTLPGANQRACGFLESLSNRAQKLWFREHRIMIVCSVALDSDGAVSGTRNWPIVIMVLEDVTTEDDEKQVDFLNWNDRGFTVSGINSAHHLVQATIHAALGVWAEQWSKTLDLLDDSISSEVGTV